MQNSKPLIMVVDDQVDFVEGVKLILEEEGYNVWTAFNGREALDQLQQSLHNDDLSATIKSLPDLILADIMMPIMDGYTLYENTQSNAHLRPIPFVFLTARTDSADIERGKELGVEDYLTKPCLPDILLASVRGQLIPNPSQGNQSFDSYSSFQESNRKTEDDSPNRLMLFVGISIIVIIFIVLMSLDIPWA